jgi:hypothetical protein
MPINIQEQRASTWRKQTKVKKNLNCISSIQVIIGVSCILSTSCNYASNCNNYGWYSIAESVIKFPQIAPRTKHIDQFDVEVVPFNNHPCENCQKYIVQDHAYDNTHFLEVHSLFIWDVYLFI